MMSMDKKVLDVYCGSKMMWFQPNRDFVEFCDIRDEEIEEEKLYFLCF